MVAGWGGGSGLPGVCADGLVICAYGAPDISHGDVWHRHTDPVALRSVAGCFLPGAGVPGGAPSGQSSEYCGAQRPDRSRTPEIRCRGFYAYSGYRGNRYLEGWIGIGAQALAVVARPPGSRHLWALPCTTFCALATTPRCRCSGGCGSPTWRPGGSWLSTPGDQQSWQASNHRGVPQGEAPRKWSKPLAQCPRRR